MGVISRMRKQNAIYWPPTTADDFGRRGHGPLVELVLVNGVNLRVRWEDKSEEFTDAQGTLQVSNAEVYVPLLPSGSEVEVGGYLWLGDRVGLVNEDDPTKNPGAFEIRQIEKLPNMKATEFLRKAVL